MIKESTLDNNINQYLNLMHEKMIQDQRRITQLQDRINNAAKRIQRSFRRFIFFKKTYAARKIQKFWKRIMSMFRQRRQKMMKFKRIFSAYKILYFFQSIKSKKNHPQFNMKKAVNKEELAKRRQSRNFLQNIIAYSPKYTVISSALQSELAYLKKYALYDRKTFTEQWEVHEKKQREWMWTQIKKKWIKKEGNIWINEAQKQVNAEKYVQNLIEQAYTKQYERLQESQRRINQNCQLIKEKIEAINQSYFSSLFK